MPCVSVVKQNAFGKGDIQRMAEDKNVERRQRFAAGCVADVTPAGCLVRGQFRVWHSIG